MSSSLAAICYHRNTVGTPQRVSEVIAASCTDLSKSQLDAVFGVA